jgi:hypothetical protein
MKEASPSKINSILQLLTIIFTCLRKMDKEVVCCSNKSNSLERKNNDHEVTHKKQEMPYERGFVFIVLSSFE